MPSSQASLFLDQLRAALLPRDGAGLSDGQLLGRFVVQRDETAFAALVRRHAPMVWGVCRRVLHRPQDAEDAFQATFLVLIRRAASVAPREQVGNWLYGVARQTALKARATVARRSARECQVATFPEPATPARDVSPDWQPLLDQELSGLPERYRLAIVLCDLEGKTRKEVARQLGLPEGTLSGWLTRGRSLLAKRLGRRGVVVSGGMLATVLGQGAAVAAPAAAVASAVRAATLSIAGRSLADCVSIEATSLTQGVMQTMFMSQFKTLAMAVVVLVAVGLGAGKLAYGAREAATVFAAAKQTQPAREQAAAELQTARAAARLADAKLAEARAQLAQAEAQMAAAKARVALLETQQVNPGGRADRTKATADASASLQALTSRFKYRVPFEIGATEESEGGRIEILEVWGTRPKIEVGGQYLVRGKCVLPPGERGALYFYETATGEWGRIGTADLDLQSTTVDKEHLEFTLLHSMAGPGFFHLRLTAVERYSRGFADVYFGTGDTVYRK